MLYYIEFENSKGFKLRIADMGDYLFSDIDGISAPDATINYESTAGYDGSTFINSNIQKRNIVLTVQLAGDPSSCKREIYKVFQIKRQGMLRLRSDGWDVKIPCYTEKIDIPPTKTPLTATISLLCLSPYWQAISETVEDIKNVKDNFYFPLVLYEEGIALGVINPEYTANVFNEGDVDLGMTVEFRAIGDVKNPRIFNTRTFEYIQINTELVSGDIVEVCTVEKQKRVTLIRRGERINYFNMLEDGSKFLQLEQGDNELRYTAEEGEMNLYMRLIYTPLYVGV